MWETSVLSLFLREDTNEWEDQWGIRVEKIKRVKIGKVSSN